MRGSNPHNLQNKFLFYYKRVSGTRKLELIKYLIIYVCEG